MNDQVRFYLGVQRGCKDTVGFAGLNALRTGANSLEFDAVSLCV